MVPLTKIILSATFLFFFFFKQCNFCFLRKKKSAQEIGFILFFFKKIFVKDVFFWIQKVKLRPQKLWKRPKNSKKPKLLKAFLSPMTNHKIIKKIFYSLLESQILIVSNETISWKVGLKNIKENSSLRTKLVSNMVLFRQGWNLYKIKSSIIESRYFLPLQPIISRSNNFSFALENCRNRELEKEKKTLEISEN